MARERTRIMISAKITVPIFVAAIIFLIYFFSYLYQEYKKEIDTIKKNDN